MTTETGIYKEALLSTELFPAGDYHIHRIYEIIKENVPIPQHHFENRPTVKFEIWKNHIHTILPHLERTENFKKEWHRFK